MSRFEKALARLKSKPRDLTWRETQTILSHFGYEEVKGGGSRRKFINSKTKVSISLHEPHPKPILKMYAIDLIINHLKEEGLL
jgi:hypothetical protein